MAGNYTCGARIKWAKSNKGKTNDEAKTLVSSEFPTECGACAPANKTEATKANKKRAAKSITKGAPKSNAKINGVSKKRGPESTRPKKWHVRTLMTVSTVGDQGVLDLSLIDPTKMLVTETQSLVQMDLTQKVRCRRWMTQDLKWLPVPQMNPKYKANQKKIGAAVYSLSDRTGVRLADGSRWKVKALRAGLETPGPPFNGRGVNEKTVVCFQLCNTTGHDAECTVDSESLPQCCVVKRSENYDLMNRTSIDEEVRKVSLTFQEFGKKERQKNNPLLSKTKNNITDYQDVTSSGMAQDLPVADYTLLL